MRSVERNIRLAGGVILVIGLLAAAVAIFSEQLGFGEEAARGMFGWKRISLLTVGVLVAGVGAVGLAFPRAVANHFRHERYRRFVQRLVVGWDRRLTYLAAGLLGLLGLVLLWTRLINIDSSLWHDEAFTVLNFSSVGPSAILLWENFHFNNHPAFNFLSWVMTTVFGASEGMYRFWSIVPGIAAIGVITWWSWNRLGRVVAVAFATIAVAAPVHLQYATQARGYGLALLAASLLLVAADRLTRAYSPLTLVGFAAAGLLGIWTLITFSVAFVGQALAMLRWPHLRVPAIVAIAAVGGLALAAYAPVMGGVTRSSGVSGTTISLHAALLLDRPLEWMVIPTFTLLFEEHSRTLDGSGVLPDAPWATWIDVTAFALLVIGLVALWRRGNGGLALLLLLPPLFFNLYLSLDQQATTVRHQLFLLPYIIVPVAVAIGEIGRLAARSRVLKPIAVVVGVVAVLALAKAIVEEEQERRLPLENFKGVASVAANTGIGTIITDSHRPHGLRYYLGDSLTEMPAYTVETLLCDPDEELVYIRHVALPSRSWGSWRPADLDCLIERNAARVRVPQRGRGSAIDVWILDSIGREEIRDDVPYAREEATP